MILKRFTKFSDFTVKTPYKRRTVREILLAILLLYDGKNIYEVTKIPRICERTIKELADGTKKSVILTRSKRV